MSATEVAVFLIPRKDANPAELKQLCDNLCSLGEYLDEKNISNIMDPLPLGDLRNGELPQPLALRNTIGPIECQNIEKLFELVRSRGNDPTKLTEEEKEKYGFRWRPPEPGALRRERQDLGEAANLRGIQICYDDYGAGGLERFFEILREYISEELIEELVILPV